MYNLEVHWPLSETSLLSVSVWSRVILFFQYVHGACAYLFSCLSSAAVLADSYTLSPCCRCTLSAALHMPGCCWEASGILHLSKLANTHTNTHICEIFGCAFLGLASHQGEFTECVLKRKALSKQQGYSEPHDQLDKIETNRVTRHRF